LLRLLTSSLPGLVVYGRKKLRPDRWRRRNIHKSVRVVITHDKGHLREWL
jgi:hypothetical protein